MASIFANEVTWEIKAINPLGMDLELNVNKPESIVKGGGLVCCYQGNIPANKWSKHEYIGRSQLLAFDCSDVDSVRLAFDRSNKDSEHHSK